MTAASGRRVLLDARALQDRSAVRGIGTYVRGLLEGLHAIGAGDRVDLMLRSGEPEPSDAWRWGSLPGPRLPVLKRRLQPVADPFMVAAVLARRRRDYRLYHATEWAQPVRTRLPVVVTVHDLIPFVFPHDYPWVRRERLLALRLVRHAGAVITPSSATAVDLVRLARVDRRRIHVVPHGLDARFAPSGEAATLPLRVRWRLAGEYVLSVGTFDPHKRLALLLEVFGRLHRHRPDLSLLIAGDQGAYAAAVEAEIASSGLGAHVRLAGYVSAGELVALYSGARCLLFPSAYEGFGLPLLEAMACGCPVAAFANSAVPEVVAGAGIVAPDGDAAAMAGAVTRLLEDDAAWCRRSARGRKHAARFTWEECARRTVDVYDAVSNGARSDGKVAP